MNECQRWETYPSNNNGVSLGVLLCDERRGTLSARGKENDVRLVVVFVGCCCCWWWCSCCSCWFWYRGRGDWNMRRSCCASNRECAHGQNNHIDRFHFPWDPGWLKCRPSSRTWCFLTRLPLGTLSSLQPSSSYSSETGGVGEAGAGVGGTSGAGVGGVGSSSILYTEIASNPPVDASEINGQRETAKKLCGRKHRTCPVNSVSLEFEKPEWHVVGYGERPRNASTRHKGGSQVDKVF